MYLQTTGLLQQNLPDEDDQKHSETHIPHPPCTTVTQEPVVGDQKHCTVPHVPRTPPIVITKEPIVTEVAAPRVTERREGRKVCCIYNLKQKKLFS